MKVESEVFIEMYRRMKRIREFENAVNELWYRGEVPGYCHSSIGQEAAVVGACMALNDDDYITGTHRSHAHPIGKGAQLDALMAELLGKETGVCKGRGGSMHFADSRVGVIGESAIVGGGIPLATGAALSAQIRGTKQVGLSFFGDGAVNQGAFHESINMAAVWKLPVVYVCENNYYAISTPLTLSHGQPDIYKRAEGYGVPGLQVDGQDVMAVYDVVCTAVERARSGSGPTLVEAQTYRFDEHNTGLELPSPYRDEREVVRQKETRDPINKFCDYLILIGIERFLIEDVDDEVMEEVNMAVEFARNSPLPDPSTLYQYMYCN